MKITDKQKLEFADSIISKLENNNLLSDEHDSIDEEQLEETCMSASWICDALVEAGIVSSVGF